MSTAKAIALGVVVAINITAFVMGWLAFRKANEARLRQADRDLRARPCARQSQPLPRATGTHQPTIRATCPCGDWFSIEVAASWDKSAPEGRDGQ